MSLHTIRTASLALTFLTAAVLVASNPGEAFPDLANRAPLHPSAAALWCLIFIMVVGSVLSLATIRATSSDKP